MLVVMQEGATEEQIDAVIERMVEKNFTVHRSTGVVLTVLGGVGPEDDFDPREFEVMDGVKECHRITSPYKLAGRTFRPGGTAIPLGGAEIGGKAVFVMAGPCGVESEDQIDKAAQAVARGGARAISAGIFQPKPSSYGFQGLGEEGLRLLRNAARRHDLAVVSEVADRTQIQMVARYADILQVGARNMQNFTLLRELGKTHKPVLLKRGPAATVEELLVSAEYILTGGNYNVVLCECGIRTFESQTAQTMDVSAIPALKKLSHLPVLADPSAGTGRRDKVLPMARAAIAAGADGLLVEVHPDPDRALWDGPQSLAPDQFSEMMAQIGRIAAAVGRAV